MIRMTNVSLEPGTWELDDLIADTEDGILMETNRSWSIDDRRYNFQFGTEMGYEISRASWASCSGTAPTPASPLSSGILATPCVTRTTG